MYNVKGQPKSGACRTGEDVRAVLRAWKAVSASGVQTIFSGCPFLVRSDRGQAIEEKLGMKHL